jgi:hypothetical protein
MKANKELIKVLRDTAKYLKEKPEEYNWLFSHSCNCGLVARVANNLNNKNTKDFFILDKTWTSMSEEFEYDYFDPILQKTIFCKGAKLTYKEVFDSLIKIGFELKDFKRLEFLEDHFEENIIYDTVEDTEDAFYTDKDYLYSWLLKEANKLELELKRQQQIVLSKSQTVVKG